MNFLKCDREDILFNLGGVLNHNLYWNSISPRGEKPSGKLKECIDKTFGSLDDFFAVFKEQALKLEGSGYTFLVISKEGNLEIMNFLNQETPLSKGYIPLFNVDVWEHAYYLNYENERNRYLDNFFNIADFTYASEMFNSILLK